MVPAESEMRASSANDANHLRERAVEMRTSSKELKDNNTAALIMRLADLYDRLADRAETRGDRGVQWSRPGSAASVGAIRNRAISLACRW